VNGSGHQDRAYYEPAPFFDRHLAVRVDRPIRRVLLATPGDDPEGTETELPFEQADGRVRVTLPRLDLLARLALE
jgi:hypothetical protein